VLFIKRNTKEVDVVVVVDVDVVVERGIFNVITSCSQKDRWSANG
jgi:hypothetical protein